FQNVSNTAGSADAGNRGWWKSDRGAFGKFAKNVVKMNDHVDVLLILCRPLGPRVEGYPEECVVCSRHAAQHAVANHGCDMCDAGSFLQEVFHFACRPRRTLQ